MGSFIPSQDMPADVDITPLPPSDVLLSLRTGKIRPLGGAKIRSAINKSPRQGRVKVTELGLAGDERQYAAHWGIDKALHQYCAGHYKVWNEIVPNREHLFKIGGFGENLSTAALTESNVCIGDKFRLGPEVIVQVSEPRQPCYKLNHRFEYKKASSVAQETGLTGWYLRVLKPGYIEEGDTFELIERLNPRWSISNVQKYLYHDVDDKIAGAELSQLPGLGTETRDIFRSRLVNGAEDMNGRLEGDCTPVAWRSYGLLEKSDLTPRIKKFVFQVDETSADIQDFELGRFAHVRLQFGPNLKFSRAYSVISGDMRRFELGVSRDDNSRGGSVYLHEKVQVGDIVKAAKGHAGNISTKLDSLGDSEERKHIFIVGGIGLTAFLSEITLLSRKSADIEIHYAVRSRNEAAYLERLPKTTTTVYAKDEGERLDLERILPTSPDGVLHNTMIYCCGPKSLLEAFQKLARKLCYPPSHVHLEEFGGAATGTGEPFEAEIKATGGILRVPGEKSLLQVLNEAGFEIESSCLVGNCGTCMVDYCEGEVEHRGVALEDEQKPETMLTCVSRGKGRIVIDC